MRRLARFVLAALVVGGAAVIAPAQTLDKKTLTLAGAKTLAAAAEAEAKKNNAGGAIAVVDDGGNLLLLERLDNTFSAAANIAIAKARSATNFRKAPGANVKLGVQEYAPQIRTILEFERFDDVRSHAS